MEEQHIAETSVRQGGTEHRDGVLVGPVVDGGPVVDLLAEAGDHGAGRPDKRLLVALGGFLLLEHLVEDGNDPVFKGAVVVVRDNQVPDSIHALCS